MADIDIINYDKVNIPAVRKALVKEKILLKYGFPNIHDRLVCDPTPLTVEEFDAILTKILKKSLADKTLSVKNLLCGPGNKDALPPPICAIFTYMQAIQNETRHAKLNSSFEDYAITRDQLNEIDEALEKFARIVVDIEREVKTETSPQDSPEDLKKWKEEAEDSSWAGLGL